MHVDISILEGGLLFKRITTTINTDTGQVKETERHFSYWNDEKGYLFRSQAKGLTLVSEDFPDVFTFYEKGMIFELIRYIFKDSNILSKRTKHGIRPLNTNDISKILGIEKSQTYNFIKKLIKYSILARVKIEVGERVETQYWLNPAYFIAGKYINSNLYFVFRESLKDKIPDYIREKFESTETEIKSVNGRMK